MTKINFPATLPIRVGLVGTGFAAKLRAETLQTDERSHLVAVAGHTPQKTQEFAQTFNAEATNSWQELIKRSDIDLVIICTINRDHGEIARAALNAGKHVIVEYPLALEATEAEELIALAAIQKKLLHVEHIELLGGLHQALKQSLSKVGNPFYVRYSTINPQTPAPQRWTYNRDLFGFPLAGALSRLHRLTDAFDTVATVSCQLRYWERESPFYTACLCNALLRFTNGAIAEVVYGKGEVFSVPSRLLEVHGDKGSLIFDGDEGKLIQGEETTPIEVGSRRGLFVKDTQFVLDHLVEGTPLYVTPQASLYSLRVANAAQHSAATGEMVEISL